MLRAGAAQIFWVNTAGGNWTNTANWSPSTIPTLNDTAVITNTGNYTVTISSAATAGTIQMGYAATNATGIRTLALTAGSLTLTNAQLETNAPVIFSAGNLSVRGLMQARGDFTWTAGTIDGGGELQAGSGIGITTISGAGLKGLNGVTFGNQSYACAWSGANPTMSAGATFYNAGALNLSADQTLTYSSGATVGFDNYGTINKNGGTGQFLLSLMRFRNSGTINIYSGSLALTSITATNTGNLNFSAGCQLLFNSGTLQLGGAISAPTADSLRFIGGTATITTASITSPSIWIAGATVQQQAAISVPTVNQSSGSFALSLACNLATYNLTNGSLLGGTLTVTNFAWTDGILYAMTNGDRVIIPTNGVFNLLGAGEKSLFYQGSATLGYGIDNYGAWNWSGACILRGFGSTVNNYGTVTMTAPTLTYYSYYSGAYPTPRWNNFGTFTKSTGAGIFSFNGSIVNNSGTLNVQAGTCTFESSTKFTNSASIIVGVSAVLLNDSASETTYLPTSSLTAVTANSVRIPSGTVYLQTTSVATPALWINGGTLYQQSPNVVDTINQSAGYWWLNQVTGINTYNLTNGILRGGTLTVTNFAWTDGGLYANTNGDKLIIPTNGVFNLLGAGEKSLFYNAPATLGYGIDNLGTWNWSGSCILRGFGSTVNNNGNVNMTASGLTYYSYYSGAYPTPTWNNNGTFTKTNGAGTFSFNGVYLNNFGLMNSVSGTLSISSSTFANYGNMAASGTLLQFYTATGTNYSSIVLGAATPMTVENGSAVTFAPTASLYAPTVNLVQILGGSLAVSSVSLNTPSLLINGGTLYQRTNIVVSTINMSGVSSAFQLDVPCALNQLNQTNGYVQGRNLTVTNWLWLDGYQMRGTPGINTTDDRTIIPAGGTLTFPGVNPRYLSYHSGVGPSRTLDNYGTINWTGAAVLYSYGVLNNYGTTTVSAVGTPQYAAYNANIPPTWNNFGTFTRNAGTLFYFSTAYVNNSGLMDIQQGTLSIYASVFTNLTGGNILIQPGVVLANDNSSTSTFESGSSLACASTNAFQINSGTVTLRSPSVTAPSLWINGGILNQNTNIAVTTINESSGIWQLNVPVNLTTYNLTNGELRGGNLTMNNFNWLGGTLYASGAVTNLVTVSSQLNISGASAKTMSYVAGTTGRNLINNGTATWGGVGITGAGGATIQNNGTFNLTNDVGLVLGSGSPTVFQNNGTFTKSAGTGVANFAGTIFTNTSTLAINSGGITIGGSFVQTAGSAYLGTNFSASSDVRIQAGSLTGRGNIAGAFYNNGIVNPGSSPGYINGATFTNTSAATYNIEIGGNTGAGTNYDQMRFSGPVTLDGTLNVSLYNGYALILSNRFTVLTTSARTGTFASVIPPPGATLNTIYSPTNVILEVAALTNAPLQILTNPVSQTIWTPDSVTFAAAVSGTTPISFQWQLNGTNIAGATNNTYTIAAVAVTNAGLYTLQIADSVGGTTNTSATLTVIPFANTIWWTNTLGGNWSVPANWLPNRIPNGANNVIIVSNGTYTVIVDVPAALSNLTVGSRTATGTPTVHLVSGQSLTVNGNTSWETNSILALNGLLQMNGGSNSVRGQINWQLGTLSGAGRTVIASNATLTFIGSLNQKFIVSNILENYGTFNYGNDSFGNAQGLRFSGGANLTNYPSGIISIPATAYDYSGAQTPRSYLVNYGTISADSPGIFSPSYISIDFINYGTLQDNGYCYLSRGTNYGTFGFANTLCEVSVFGDETTGEYFSFEDGTVFSGAFPRLAVGGYAQWNTTATHPGRVIVISGTGGASFANPEFRILKNYTQSGTTIVQKGRWTQANPALTADLNDFSDSLVNGAHTFVITNAGTLRANTFSHNVRTLFNSGSISVRTNLTLAGSSYTYGGGTITISNTASATFSGGTVEAQTVLNRGTNTVNGAMAFTANTFYRNFAGARTYFGGGSFGTGPASLLNEGLLDGFGGLAITSVTNRGTVLANDSLSRSLALGTYRQESGLTDLNPGSVSGALEILGGLFTGTNTVTGSVRNLASVAPGKPFGLLTITGNYTNDAAGFYYLPINGARAITNFPQLAVQGTNYLAGTLSVNFTNGFTPAPGNLFTAMVFTARSGVFDSIVNDTYGLEAFYTPTQLVLRAQNLLPNVTISTFGVSNTVVCQQIKISASAADPDGVVTNLLLKLNGITIASSSGATVKSFGESDFPMVMSIAAQATDDRGGVRTVTQAVNVFNFSQTNVLFLGGVRSNDFKLCMVGEPAKNYDIYGTTNLATTNWLNLGTMTVSNGTWLYLDSRTITNRPYRFYRAKQLP